MRGTCSPRWPPTPAPGSGWSAGSTPRGPGTPARAGGRKSGGQRPGDALAHGCAGRAHRAGRRLRHRDPAGQRDRRRAGQVPPPGLEVGRAEDSVGVTRWCTEALDVLTALAADSGTGIRLVSGIDAARARYPRPGWAAPLPGLRPCDPADLPSGFTSGWRYTAPVVSMP